jgi:hypothetical protein
MPISKNKIEAIKDSFSKAEKLVKDCEIITGELPLGAVNELRYASSHLIEYLDDGNEEQYKKFDRHCKRAKYDSQEVPVLLLTKRLDKYLSRFQGNEDIAANLMGEDYNITLDVRQNVDEVLSKANKDKNSRESYLEDIQKVLPKLQSILNRIERLVPAIESKIKKEKERNILTKIGLVITSTLSIIAIIVTVYLSAK